MRNSTSRSGPRSASGPGRRLRAALAAPGTALRHVVTLLVAGLLIYVFGLVHDHWHSMHRWNKATGDASVVLLALTMAIGPATRLWPTLRRLIPFRREWGIHAMLLALAHTAIILHGWVEWDLARLFGFEFHPLLGHYVMVQHGFGLANLIALFGPKAVIVESQPAAVGAALLRAAEKALKTSPRAGLLAHCVLLSPELGESAPVLGAAAWAARSPS